MTKYFLAGLTVKWHPLALKSSLINRLGLNNGISRNLLQTPKNLEFRLDVSWRPAVVIVTIPFVNNHSYFILVIAIGNLQFNKTLCSVTYIDCKLYTCFNSSISFKNESLLILQSRHNLWLPVNLQRPWEEDPMAGLAS